MFRKSIQVFFRLGKLTSLEGEALKVIKIIGRIK